MICSAGLPAGQLQKNQKTNIMYRANPHIMATSCGMTMPCLLYAGELDEPYYSDSKAAAAQLQPRPFWATRMKHGDGGAAALLVPHIHTFLSGFLADQQPM